jgi:hypothetical protein
MHSDPKTPTLVIRNPIQLLSFGIFALGILAGFALAFPTAEPSYPYPRELRAIYWVGEGVVYGLSIAFLGVLASQYNHRGRQESLRLGEWLGIVTSVLVLSGIFATFFTPSLSGPLLFARCLVLCLAWIAAVGLLLARPFMMQRPEYRPSSHSTEIGGLLLCAVTAPFIGWQFTHSLTYL